MSGARYLPILDWGRRYDRASAGRDALAALIVSLMLIPQSLAYATLAGLPPVAGLYASILPLIAYGLFGSSSSLSVGPVAVISLMTAVALAPLFAPGTAEYAAAAALLALLSGLILLLMALLRLGFLANFLSHPVISGFISASALLIALSQIEHLLGLSAGGDTAPAMLSSLLRALPQTHWPTALVSAASLAALLLIRCLESGLLAAGLGARWASALSKAGPAVVVVAAIVAAGALDLAAAGVAVLGTVPAGLPPLALPPLDPQLAARLLPAALLISLVGFVESVSIGHTLAAKRRQRISPDQELVGLGAANIAAAVGGGFPVTGGFSRSVVNFDAGAQTPMAGLLAAAGIGMAALLLTPLLRNLPQAVLAAVIVVAVLGLVDLAAIRRSWGYSRQDFSALAATALGVLLAGVEVGLLLGVGVSLLLFLWRTSRPHMAVVGLLPGSEHFRNVDRYKEVIESPGVLSLRIDESLYFPNARYLEERVLALVAARPRVTDLVLMCPGVNLIDSSGLDSLASIAERLRDAGVRLHLSEVKGPVMDQLRRSDFLQRFGVRVFISQYEALLQLDPRTAHAAGERAGGRAGSDAGRTGAASVRQD